MKKIIPYGNRILVKRRAIGEKLGSGIILASADVADRLTEIAEIVAVPNLTLADKMMLEKADSIIGALVEKAYNGDSLAVKSLLDFTSYLQIKTLKVGDVIMIGRYATVEFNVGETGETLSIVEPEGIRGLVLESK